MAERGMDASVQKAPMDSIIQYNAACFYALEGMTDKALDCLENCLVKVGNISREWLEHDSDLDGIRDQCSLVTYTGHNMHISTPARTCMATGYR